MSTSDASGRPALDTEAVVTFSSELTERAHLASRHRRLAVDAAIALAVAAALAQAVSAPEHWRWWPASGVFFVVIGVAQAALAVALFRKPVRDPILAVGVWGTVAVIGVYVVSRTTGIPFAPPVLAHGARWVPGRSIVPGVGRYVGALDIFTLATEIVLVLVLTGLMTRVLRQRMVTHLMWIGLVMWALAGLSVL